METDKYILFFGNSNNYGFLSQWYHSLFIVDDMEYFCAEQWMMAEKARLFKDKIALQNIMNATHPKTIKAEGRKIKNFNNEIWNNHKYDIVLNGTRHKFHQNSNLSEKLLATVDKKLVEASPYDKIWGIGLNASAAIKIPENKWPGQNLLGKILMQVRDEIDNLF